MKCPNIPSLVSALEQSPSQLAEFGQYLTVLRNERGWTSPTAMAKDPVIVREYGLKGRGDSFRRALERVIRDRYCPTARTVKRFAEVFFSRDRHLASHSLLQGFERWRSDMLGERLLLEQKAPVIEVRNGRWLLRDGAVVEGETGERYLIKRRITSSQSRSESYKAKRPSGGWVFIKTMSLPANMTACDMELRIARFNEIFDREGLSLRELTKAARVVGVGSFVERAEIPLVIGGKVLLAPALVQEFLLGANLAAAFSKTRRFSMGGSGALKWLVLARRLLEILRDIHDTNLVHGDVQPANILLHRGRLSLVDFTEGTLNTAEASMGASTSTNIFSAFTAPERIAEPDRPFDLREDLYGAAATLFWIACNTFPPTDQQLELEVGDSQSDRIRGFIRRHVSQQLLNHNEGALHVIAQGLQRDPGDRPANATDMLRTLDAFERIEGRSAARPITISEEASRLAARVNTLPRGSLFLRIVERDVLRVLRRTRDMAEVGRCEITGNRDDVIHGVLDFMAALEEGDLYATVTTPTFWKNENLGINGRFLCANKMLARRGVRVRRLFALLKSELEEPKTLELIKRVFDAQRRVIHELMSEGVNTLDPDLATAGYYVGVAAPFQSESDRQKVITGGRHIGIVRKGQQVLSLSFEESRGLVRRVTMWQIADPAMISKRLAAVSQHLLHSKPITDFVEESKTADDTPKYSIA